MENQSIIETEYSWIIQIPSYIKHKFDTYSTREGYVDSHDLMMAKENGVRPHYPREDWILSATQQTDCVSESLEQIVCQFKEIMFMKGYDQKVKSADLHKGRTNHQSHVRFIMHDDIIVIKTCGSPITIGDPDGWVDAMVQINVGQNKDKKAKIIKIDMKKKRPYSVVIDGGVCTYSRNQISLMSRDILRKKIGDPYALSFFGGLHPVLHAFNKITNIGNIEIPGYDPKTTLKCKVWFDPIIVETGDRYQYQLLHGPGHKKFWAYQDHDFMIEPTASWTQKKPIKGARSC